MSFPVVAVAVTFPDSIERVSPTYRKPLPAPSFMSTEIGMLLEPVVTMLLITAAKDLA